DARRPQQYVDVDGALGQAAIGVEPGGATGPTGQAQHEQPAERIEIDGQEQQQRGADEQPGLAPHRARAHPNTRQSCGRDVTHTSWPGAKMVSCPRYGRLTLTMVPARSSTVERTSSPRKTASRTRPGQQIAPAAASVTVSRRAGRMWSRRRLPAAGGGISH